MIDILVDEIVMIISISFISALIGITVYVVAKSWEEGKTRYFEREAERELIEQQVRQEEINMKRLENLKLENLEIRLTSEDMELLNLMTGSNGTARGTLGKFLREHLKLC